MSLFISNIFKKKINLATGLLTALFAFVMPMSFAAEGGPHTSYWVSNQWPGTIAMLSTMDMLQTVNVSQMDQMSSTPIIHMLSEKALMNEVVQQLESTPRLSGPFRH